MKTKTLLCTVISTLFVLSNNQLPCSQSIGGVGNITNPATNGFIILDSNKSEHLTNKQWFDAIKERNIDVIKEHVDGKKGTFDYDNHTALMISILNNDLELIKILAPYKAWIRKTEHMNNTKYH